MMNDLQQKIYSDLMALMEQGSRAFFYTDTELDGIIFRIFSYDCIPHSSMWLINDSALECRGITFEMEGDNPVRLVSWPFEKFFNHMENMLTSDLDLSTATEIVVKKDGSLMSSMYLTAKDDLYLKSKGSLKSEQAVAANKLIRHHDWRALYNWTLDWASRGYTVIFEYTSPRNRIVVSYKKTELTVLAIRNHTDGSYVDLLKCNIPPEIQNCVVTNLKDQIDDPVAFAAIIPKTEGLEGYVIRLESGQRVKIKTTWYNKLHFENNCMGLSDLDIAKAVLDQTVDDLRAIHGRDSPETLERIDRVCMVVSNLYNSTVKTTTDFFNQNKDLSRRDYAALAKQELTITEFGLAMQLYADKPVDFAAAILRHLIKDKVLQTV